MTNDPKVLAVIPARGGSKRLPRKNIINVSGHPMVAYTIMAAKNASKITDWLVSSEDEEILKVAKEYNAPTPFKRPKELATDEVRNIEVTLHALEWMEAKKKCKYDIIVLLQPTSPIRSSKHIDQAIQKLWESNLDSLAAVKGPFQKRDPILKRVNDKGEMVAYSADLSLDSREPFYIYNAALYAVKRDYFVKEKKFTADKQVPFVMDKYYSVDVDELADLIIAEEYLKVLQKDKELI
jgi:CMP-N,N'-diacetyllegionaminic acid synthase